MTGAAFFLVRSVEGHDLLLQHAHIAWVNRTLKIVQMNPSGTFRLSEAVMNSLCSHLAGFPCPETNPRRHFEYDTERCSKAWNGKRCIMCIGHPGEHENDLGFSFDDGVQQ